MLIRSDEYRAEPGIWTGVSNHAYRSLPERPWGTSDIVTCARRSPAHVGLDVIEETDAMRRGTMIHMAILEPDEFEDHYVTLDPADYPDAVHDLAGLRAWLKSGGHDIKARSFDDLVAACHDAGLQPPLWSTICAEQAGDREMIPASDYETMVRAGESVRSHPLYADITEGECWSELSIIAEVEGQLVRARPDLVARKGDHVTLIDLKTTRDASPLGWRQSVERYGSHYQLTLQRLALEAHGLTVDRQLWVCVETAEPYACAMYALDDYSAGRAEADVRHVLRQLGETRDPFAWRGYPDRIHTLHMRPWSFIEDRED